MEQLDEGKLGHYGRTYGLKVCGNEQLLQADDIVVTGAVDKKLAMAWILSTLFFDTYFKPLPVVLKLECR